MLSIQSKLPDVGTTIFIVMSRLAQEHNAVNMGQGFPDFPMSSTLTDAVCKAMNDGYNQYAHTNGLPLLREAICAQIKRLYHADVNWETEITIVPGASYAIATALSSIINKGDEVIVLEPAYDSYVPNIIVNGGVPVFVSLQYPDYTIDWNEVKKKITAKTGVIIINTPHNPTGSVLEEADIQQLINITQNTNIVLISDEVYEHLVYDGKQHQSIVKFPQLRERSFACFSFGKTYHCTGWKIGYCIAGEMLMKEFRKLHQFNAFSTNTPMQVGLATVLQDEPSSSTSLSGFMQQKRDYFRKLMSDTLFTPLPCFGSFFQCYSYANLSNKSDKEMAVDLVENYGVATIPLSAFYHNATDNKVLRFCFAKKESTLQEAAERLCRLQ